jgi:hypothetical protein
MSASDLQPISRIVFSNSPRRPASICSIPAWPYADIAYATGLPRPTARAPSASAL